MKCDELEIEELKRDRELEYVNEYDDGFYESYVEDNELELYEGFFEDGNMKKYGGFNRTTKVETYRKYVKEFDLSDDFSYYCREVFEEFKYD
jgi:hypothetical protein|tara:strand:+ start:280 stop:555 length:276 start_codon:yes stop_codon:yes gene_type:complete